MHLLLEENLPGNRFFHNVAEEEFQEHTSDSDSIY